MRINKELLRSVNVAIDRVRRNEVLSVGTISLLVVIGSYP